MSWSVGKDCDFWVSIRRQELKRFNYPIPSTLEQLPVRLVSTKKQRLLTTQPLGPMDFGGGSGGTLTTYRHDKDNVRECLAKMVTVHDLLMAMDAILDPRYKMKLIEFYYSKIYPSFKAREEIELVLFSLHELYVEYVANYATNDVNPSDQARGSFPTKNNSSSRMKSKTKGRAEFDLWAQELDTIVPIKSDLDIYLEEGSVEDYMGLILLSNNQSDIFTKMESWQLLLRIFLLKSSSTQPLLLQISAAAGFRAEPSRVAREQNSS
ncbi:hypothetical protein BUALT_Bualt09G0117200 [Buddleja alternifolia]|uniref:hAT-like transposase RNase-H fold domain-containing protein n=1 Tax=Buddleja alternifolia TaxID=168488 RepID=A0AAV6X1W6_9LAMI|nr:hypothetical protein BUALT_Bualt09G0117200 [Buddleja alternifolia]